VFGAVAEEAARLLQAEFAVVSRHEEGLATLVGSRTTLWPDRPLPVGSHVKLGGRNTVSMVFQTGRPARIDDYDAASGPWAEMARDRAYRSTVSQQAKRRILPNGPGCVPAGERPMPPAVQLAMRRASRGGQPRCTSRAIWCQSMRPA
jgi:hypothetical protein